MSDSKQPQFMPSLTLSAMLCLSSCVAENYSFCPVYPLAGPSVAAELEHLAAEDYPDTWEWIGRIDKLRQELEICKQTKGD